MALSFNTNLSALNSTRQLNLTNQALATSLERLSSGLRINSAKDDAAGLSVREGLRADLAGLRASDQNALQASDLLQTAEGSLAQVSDILIRARSLAVQSSSSTLTDTNRTALQSEFSQLVAEIDRIAQSTTFNQQVLLTGFGNSVDATSTALTTSDVTGVTRINLSGAQTGTFTFIDTAGDNQVTLGDGTVTQTISVGTLLDGSEVATGTQVVANFDRLGIQVTLAGAGVTGASGQFTEGDLDAAEIVVQAGTGGSFQVGTENAAANRIEVNDYRRRQHRDGTNGDYRRRQCHRGCCSGTGHHRRRAEPALFREPGDTDSHRIRTGCGVDDQRCRHRARSGQPDSGTGSGRSRRVDSGTGKSPESDRPAAPASISNPAPFHHQY